VPGVALLQQGGLQETGIHLGLEMAGFPPVHGAPAAALLAPLGLGGADFPLVLLAPLGLGGAGFLPVAGGPAAAMLAAVRARRVLAAAAAPLTERERVCVCVCVAAKGKRKRPC
jgi:hypothetical protein